MKLSLATWSLLVIAVILLLGIPFANRYVPYTNTFGRLVDVWQVDPKSDPHYQYRYNVILFGFTLTALSILPLLMSFIFRKGSTQFHLLNVMVFLLIFSIGFKNYPYWANGLFYVYSIGSKSTAYDPKAILPITEFGEIWVDLVFYFYLLCFALILYLVFAQLVRFFLDYERPEKTHQPLILSVSVLLVLSFFATPNFIGLLAD